MKQYFERLKPESLTQADGMHGSVPVWLRRLHTQGEQSGCAALLFMLHPLADEIGAGNKPEVTTLTAEQIHQGRAIQFFETSQVEHWPQDAVDRRGNELAEIFEVTLRQAAGDADRHAWRNYF